MGNRTGELRYEVVQGWGKLPEGWVYTQVPGVAVDSRDRVFVFCRGEHPVTIFDREGNFQGSWGEGVFTTPHGIFIDAEGRVYVPELQSRMSVLDKEGRLLARWGGEKTHEPGLFVAPHCAWADTHGGLYVGEALQGQRIQKFELQN